MFWFDASCGNRINNTSNNIFDNYRICQLMCESHKHIHRTISNNEINRKTVGHISASFSKEKVTNKQPAPIRIATISASITSSIDKVIDPLSDLVEMHQRSSHLNS